MALLVAVEPDVGNQDVAIVRDEVFYNGLGAVDDVDIAPVNPAVFGLQGSGEQVVPRSTHGLPPRALVLELMSVLDLLLDIDAKVLSHNHG